MEPRARQSIYISPHESNVSDTIMTTLAPIFIGIAAGLIVRYIGSATVSRRDATFAALSGICGGYLGIGIGELLAMYPNSYSGILTGAVIGAASYSFWSAEPDATPVVS